MPKSIPAKKRIDVSPGESVRIIRELQVLAKRSSRHSAASRKPPFPASKLAGSTLASSAQRFWQPRCIAILPCWSSRVGSWNLLHNSSVNRARLPYQQLPLELAAASVGAGNFCPVLSTLRLPQTSPV